MTLILFVLGFILGAGAIVFAIQNTDVVALSFLSYQFESSLALLVIIFLAIGMLIGLLALLPSAISGSLKIMGLKKENEKLVGELEAKQHELAAARQSTT